MTKLDSNKIDKFLNVTTKIDTMECKLCGFTSYNSTNFHEGICLACCRIHEIDY